MVGKIDFDKLENILVKISKLSNKIDRLNKEFNKVLAESVGEKIATNIDEDIDFLDNFIANANNGEYEHKVPKHFKNALLKTIKEQKGELKNG